MAVKLSGFRELHDSLEQFKKGTERSILRRTAIKALEPFVERAKQNAPVDTGDLRDSIVIGTKLTSRAKRADRKEPKRGVRVFAGTADRNAVPQEFGSERSAAQPFMGPAWEASKEGMLDIVKAELAADIARTAARAAKKGRKT